MTYIYIYIYHNNHNKGHYHIIPVMFYFFRIAGMAILGSWENNGCFTLQLQLWPELYQL